MTSNDKIIKMERQFDASVPEVFDAIKNGVLFLSCGFEKDTMKIDFSVGGKYALKYGKDDLVSGDFLEIEPNKKIVFTWSEAGRVTIDLSTKDNGTALKLVHEQIPTEILFQQITEGWTGGLNDFQGTF